MNILTDITTAFLLGLLTPLSTVCVIPLYPGYLSFLASKLGKNAKVDLFNLSLIVALGILTFMGILGLLFTTILQVSLTNIIGIVSPIAFGILALISIFLIFQMDFSRFLPKINYANSKLSPKKSAFLFGFFFGAIVIPCNPLFIAAFFAKAVTIDRFVVNIFSFLFFGLGMAAPLILLSSLSNNLNRKLINFLTSNKKIINIISGLLMLIISFYYLFFVFF